ncbi:MAG: hypothetical protein K0M60_11520 [Hydrogenophaga sp.]|nr:hypothetical protein [Hydrogenophaga sp.]
MRSTTLTTLLAIHAALVLPLSAKAQMQAAPDIDESDEYPMAEICLLPDGMRGNTCAAFFLDEDGYEICLRDEMSGRMRCSSSHGTKDDEPQAPAPSPSGMVGI